MEQTAKNQVVIAAVNAAGPVGDDAEGWKLRVLGLTGQLVALTSPGSDVMTLIDSINNSKVFAATLLEVTKEKSSTRGLLKLGTKVSEHTPDGVEQARTERTDTPVGLAMARRCRALVGHRVLVWIDVQQMKGSTNKVRVISHIEDLGLDEEGDAA